jgi:NitT/TauT family transport system substrate-binding protein
MRSAVWCMRRARLCFAAALFSAAVPHAASAQTPPPPTSVNVAGIPIDVSGEVFYAVELGLFKKAGLDVHLMVMGSGAAIAPGVASGSIDIGSSNFISLAQAHERGIPFLMVAPSGIYTSKSPTTQILVAKSSPMRSARDMAGKTVGVTSLNNISTVTLDAWLDKNGGDYRSVKEVEIPYPQMAPALAAGRVDAVEIAEPFLSQALAGDARSLAHDGDSIGKEWVEGGYFCTSDYEKTHPDVIRKFAAVMTETARWANAHQDQAGEILQRYSKARPAKVLYHTVFPEHFQATDAQPMIDAAAKYGALKAAFPSADMMAPEVMSQGRS